MWRAGTMRLWRMWYGGVGECGWVWWAGGCSPEAGRLGSLPLVLRGGGGGGSALGVALRAAAVGGRLALSVTSKAAPGSWGGRQRAGGRQAGESLPQVTAACPHNNPFCTSAYQTNNTNLCGKWIASSEKLTH